MINIRNAKSSKTIKKKNTLSIKQYNINISIYTKQKCWRALQSLQDN